MLNSNSNELPPDQTTPDQAAEPEDLPAGMEGGTQPQQFSVSDHWLDEAERHPSPFCDQRPPGVAVNLLVIHSISLPKGDYGGDYVRRLFLGELRADGPCGELAGVQVSSHLFIRRNGEVLQFVPFHLRAWHAGDSSYQGVAACNDYSIGIELEGTDADEFTPAQYAALTGATLALLASYPTLKPERIVGHSDVAQPRGRKHDPGSGMDWAGYLATLSASPIRNQA